MKEDINKKLDHFKMPKKFWEPSQNLIQPKNKIKNFFDHAKASSNKYKAKLTKLEQEYIVMHNAVTRQNLILRGILKKKLLNKRSTFLILKCLLAGGIVYGSVYAGIWGSQSDSEKIVDHVLNRDLQKTKSDLIMVYNDAVKFIGEQAQAMPDSSTNFITKSSKYVLDCYEEMKKKYTSK